MRRLTALCLALLLMTGCTSASDNTTSRSVTVLAMDTVMTVTAYGGGENTVELAKARILELEGLLSVTDPDSELYNLNRTGSQTLSPDAANLLCQALALCRRTAGALDLTIYPVVRAWGFTTGQYTIPDQRVISELLTRVDYTQVDLEKTTGMTTLPDGVELDLGSVAKGYTGDILAALMAEQGVDSALLELGGNIQAVGSKPDGSDWRVAIRAPEEDGGSLGVVEVSNAAVVTSGGYERFFELDGVRYWHIIDPATGSPARSGLLSVTIVGESGLYCDALSTALFVMGLERALDYWRTNRDFEAILVSEDGTVTVTSGLADSFTPSSNRTLVVANP